MLKLNTEKTRYLLFGTPQQLLKVNRPTFAANSDIIQLSGCECNLGILLDSSLTMKDHIGEAVKTVVHALVCSQRIQNAAARVIFKKSKYEHVTPLLRELHRLSVSYRILFKLLVLSFMCLHGDAPAYLPDIISIKPISTFGLRSNKMSHLL